MEMNNIKIKAQKFWLEHKHHMIYVAAGIVIGIILF